MSLRVLESPFKESIPIIIVKGPVDCENRKIYYLKLSKVPETNKAKLHFLSRFLSRHQKDKTLARWDALELAGNCCAPIPSQEVECLKEPRHLKY